MRIKVKSPFPTSSPEVELKTADVGGPSGRPEDPLVEEGWKKDWKLSCSCLRSDISSPDVRATIPHSLLESCNPAESKSAPTALHRFARWWRRAAFVPDRARLGLPADGNTLKNPLSFLGAGWAVTRAVRRESSGC